MREEIFGPILPIVEVKSAAEAIEFISSKNKPLAVYVYTDDANVFANFKHGTSSGAICQNDSCSYLLLSQLPFGGVGSSGFGNYHGRFSLETFSHKRSVHVKSRMEVIYEKFAYPPYTPEKLGWARWLLSSSERSSCTLL
ncbi:Aldehyde dehydrogenase (NAD(P)+) [Fasciola gigantica]|uniref:Aldehyde dehydrogenase (NAD(P)+) n=1 Tax=Fasciola gigantica TaxID=46835 RepID=A0A504YVV8_FASGI|nr:Aldehyde dehydrogenase (NAD(P)+) [Fasciola gigantica]